jgi:predicted amidohydrolase
MKIGYCQWDMIYRDKEANLAKLDEMLQGQDVDILVLPEFFTTGIVFQTREEFMELAEPVPEGPTCQRLAEIARKHGCTLIGSIIEVEDGGLYNAAVVIGPEGYLGKQRKVHLPDAEKINFERGDGRGLFEIGGVKIGVVICFESWFPESFRVLAAQGAQVICHTANISSSISQDAVRIRAIENVAYVVSANRIGTERAGNIGYTFRGESRVIDYEGTLLLVAGRGEEIGAVEIDPEKTRVKAFPECADVLAEVALYDAPAPSKAR